MAESLAAIERHGGRGLDFHILRRTKRPLRIRVWTDNRRETQCGTRLGQRLPWRRLSRLALVCELVNLVDDWKCQVYLNGRGRALQEQASMAATSSFLRIYSLKEKLKLRRFVRCSKKDHKGNRVEMKSETRSVSGQSDRLNRATVLRLHSPSPSHFMRAIFRARRSAMCRQTFNKTGSVVERWATFIRIVQCSRQSRPFTRFRRFLCLSPGLQ